MRRLLKFKIILYKESDLVRLKMVVFMKLLVRQFINEVKLNPQKMLEKI